MIPGCGEERQGDKLQPLPLRTLDDRAGAVQSSTEHVVTPRRQTQQRKGQVLAVLFPPEIDEQVIQANIKGNAGDDDHRYGLCVHIISLTVFLPG
jgi:hypothetical protein